MARATAAGALVLFGGTHPPGHDAASFGALVAPEIGRASCRERVSDYV